MHKAAGGEEEGLYVASVFSSGPRRTPALLFLPSSLDRRQNDAFPCLFLLFLSLLFMDLLSGRGSIQHSFLRLRCVACSSSFFAAPGPHCQGLRRLLLLLLLYPPPSLGPRERSPFLVLSQQEHNPHRLRLHRRRLLIHPASEASSIVACCKRPPPPPPRRPPPLGSSSNSAAGCSSAAAAGCCMLPHHRRRRQPATLPPPLPPSAAVPPPLPLCTHT